MDDDEPRVVSNGLKRATAARQSKIGGLIEAFQNNIVVDGALKNNCDDKKDKMRMENAFSKLMRSSIGESTPHHLRKERNRRDWIKGSH